jgi:hypothetical protein
MASRISTATIAIAEGDEEFESSMLTSAGKGRAEI